MAGFDRFGMTNAQFWLGHAGFLVSDLGLATVSKDFGAIYEARVVRG